MSEHLGRALRPIRINIPLKTGTKFHVEVDPNADEGAGMINVRMQQYFDFDIVLSIQNYGTLGDMIDALAEAQRVELERIKTLSAKARNERSRSYRPVKTEEKPVRRKRRRNTNVGIAK